MIVYLSFDLCVFKAITIESHIAGRANERTGTPGSHVSKLNHRTEVRKYDFVQLCAFEFGHCSRQNLRGLIT